MTLISFPQRPHPAKPVKQSLTKLKQMEPHELMGLRDDNENLLRQIKEEYDYFYSSDPRVLTISSNLRNIEHALYQKLPAGQT